MSLKRVAAEKPRIVTGIDCSTKSLAWATFVEQEPVRCGEVQFKGEDVFERLKYAHFLCQDLVTNKILHGDLVAIESAIMVNSNPQAAINLAYVYGAVIGTITTLDTRIVTVPPITWQSAIGNKNLSVAEKNQIKEDFPGRKQSWYTARGRSLRKERTLEFARQYFHIPGDSDNIGDAVGIAWYAANRLTL